MLLGASAYPGHVSALRLLVIEPDVSDPPGQLGLWLREAGAELDVRNPATDELPESVDGYAGLVCLGGGMGVHDVSEYPWLLALQRLLARATSAEVPTLAVCLGSQLLAAANGGTVRVAEVPEVGPGLVSKRDAAWQDPLLAEVPLLPDVLQFHGDTIETLPARADLLLSGTDSPHQAFRISRCAYGFQFHIETTPQTVLEWVAQSPDMAAWARPGAFEQDTLTQLHRDIEQVWHPVVTNFVRLAQGEIEPAGVRGPALW